MDGTLIDSEPYWIAAETELVRQHGGEWTHQDALKMVGLGLWQSASIIQAAGVDLDADSIVYGLTEQVRRALREHGVPWRPGARELLAELRAVGVKTALVTMSIRAMAEDVVTLAGFDAFDVIVAGDEVSAPKPAPEAYLRAINALKVSAGACVAIEDSLAGVQAAVSAGVATVGVPHLIDLASSPATVLWPTLAGRGVSHLSALLEAGR